MGGGLRVTTELQHEEVLDIIGLDKKRKDMIILGALLKAQRDPTDFVDFETIRKQLAIDEGSKKGKDSLVYRSLSWLESEGFLRIDRSGHKHGYNSNIALLQRALKKLLSKSTKILEKELERIDSEVAAFSEMNSGTMASMVLSISSGAKKIEKPGFAQGWDNIVKLLDDKVYSGIKKGDLIRINLDWLSQIDYLKSERALNIQRILEMGVKLKALDHDRGEKTLRPAMRKLLTKMQDSGGDVGYRVLPQKQASYQFIGRNNEGIVLIVSESPLSATWFPRSSNSELVDDAIERFDEEYGLATNLMDFEG